MQKKTKVALAVSGVLIVAGAVAGMAIAARGDRDGGWHGRHGGMMGHMGGHRGGWHKDMTAADFDTRTRERFAKFDANSDGVIDAAEVEAVFKARGEGRRGDRGARMMQRWGADKDGKVTKAAFEERIKQMFARMDLNNDGKITDDDLPPRLRGRNLLSGGEAGSDPMMGGRGGRRGGKGGMFARLRGADANKDGVITLDEVLAAAGKRFARMDKNGDGLIDQADRDAMKKEMLDYRVKRFIHRFGIDADKAGKVTRAQFEAKAKERFARLDVNKDGVITRDERGGGRKFRRGGGRGSGGHMREHGGRGSGGMGGPGGRGGPGGPDGPGPGPGQQ